jgi:hypothetical protein
MQAIPQLLQGIRILKINAVSTGSFHSVVGLRGESYACTGWIACRLSFNIDTLPLSSAFTFSTKAEIIKR